MRRRSLIDDAKLDTVTNVELDKLERDTTAIVECCPEAIIENDIEIVNGDNSSLHQISKKTHSDDTPVYLLSRFLKKYRRYLQC